MRSVFLAAALLAAAPAAADAPPAAAAQTPVSAQCLAWVDEIGHLVGAGEVCESGEVSRRYRMAALVRMHTLLAQCGGNEFEKHPQVQAAIRRHPASTVDNPERRTEQSIRAYCHAHRATAAEIFGRYAPTVEQDRQKMWNQAW